MDRRICKICGRLASQTQWNQLKTDAVLQEPHGIPNPEWNLVALRSEDGICNRHYAWIIPPGKPIGWPIILDPFSRWSPLWPKCQVLVLDHGETKAATMMPSEMTAYLNAENEYVAFLARAFVRQPYVDDD